MKHLLILLFAAVFFSCNKKKEQEEITKTFNGNLPIASTATPTLIQVGQDIISRIYFEIPSISGEIIFQDFEIKETATRHFEIRAKALYKNWNTQISLPVFMSFDTTLNIKTSTVGQYVLNFYNSTQLVQSDTVQAN